MPFSENKIDHIYKTMVLSVGIQYGIQDYVEGGGGPNSSRPNFSDVAELSHASEAR